MILKNAVVFDENFSKKRTDIKMENGKITALGDFSMEDGVDLTGCLIAPGFIDIHIHGCNGGDFCEGKYAMSAMSSHLITKGITSFCGTTMTLSREELISILTDAKNFKGNESGAKLLGVNLEGPFISRIKKGAQNEQYIRPGTIEEFDALNETSGSMVKLIDIAPESFESENFIKYVSEKAVVSVGHSNATAEQCAEAFKNGASHITHMFNAMTAFSHREPGIIGAAFDNENVMCELICDGKHVSPLAVRMAFKLLGENRCCVISDSMKAAGYKDGVFQLGGQDVYVKDGYALLKDGTIAASISNIYEEFLNLLDFGIDEKTALMACTINPAAAVGESRSIGSIKAGKDADLVIFSQDYKEIKNVVLKGEFC